MMELTPTEVHAPVGAYVTFRCKYQNHEQLNIVIIENGVATYRDTDYYLRCNDSGSKTWTIRVGFNPTFIQCMIQNKQRFVVGVLTARLYPGLKLLSHRFFVVSFNLFNGAELWCPWIYQVVHLFFFLFFVVFVFHFVQGLQQLRGSSSSRLLIE